jgi:hypothetical protein
MIAILELYLGRLYSSSLCFDIDRGVLENSMDGAIRFNILAQILLRWSC